jgi:microcystin-dependent protein
MPRPVNYPNIFGSLSGQVSASLLDQNFNAAGAIINDSSNWVNAALDTGSANNYIVTLVPPAAQYGNGFFISWLPLNANTGPSSINVNALGNIPILDRNGSALGAQALLPGTLYSMVCINSAFRIIAPDISSVIIGEIRSTGSSIIPSNWLACNGAAVDRSQYSALFAAISTSYGVGNGSTTFNVPNITGGAFPCGTTIGSSGGGTAVLAGGNLPAHNHPVTIIDPGHAHAYAQPTGGTSLSGTGSIIFQPSGIAQTATSLTGITATSAIVGNGAPFSVVPKFIGVSFIIRAF